MDRVRVLYSEGGNELKVEVDRVNENLAFVAPNKSGFSGATLKDIEDNANATISAAKQLLSLLDEFKEIVHDRAPALLGYDGFVSKKEARKIEEDKKTDKLLQNLKAYLKSDEEDAL